MKYSYRGRYIATAVTKVDGEKINPQLLGKRVRRHGKFSGTTERSDLRVRFRNKSAGRVSLRGAAARCNNLFNSGSNPPRERRRAIHSRNFLESAISLKMGENPPGRKSPDSEKIAIRSHTPREKCLTLYW